MNNPISNITGLVTAAIASINAAIMSNESALLWLQIPFTIQRLYIEPVSLEKLAPTVTPENPLIAVFPFLDFEKRDADGMSPQSITGEEYAIEILIAGYVGPPSPTQVMQCDRIMELRQVVRQGCRPNLSWVNAYSIPYRARMLETSKNIYPPAYLNRNVFASYDVITFRVDPV